ncbi:MAG: hypothetical protein R3F30_06190 [Planctomycetota bacterium]
MPKLPILALAAFLMSASTQDREERKVLSKIADEIHDHAVECFRAKWYSHARRLWREILENYDTDHEEARSALGYHKTGSVWVLGDTAYPDKDQSSESARRRLDGKWEKASQDIALLHKKEAERLRKLGDEARSNWHLDRALRFRPEDAEIAALRQFGRFEQFHGTADEVEMVRRSRLMNQAKLVVMDMEVPVERIQGRQHPIVAKVLGDDASLDGVKTEHMELWGDIGVDALEHGARFAERAWHWSRAVFAHCNGWEENNANGLVFIFLRSKATWARFVQALSSSPNDAEFTIKYANSANFGNLFVMSERESLDQVQDNVVRRVSWRFSPIGSEALREGLGHAVVAFFFGKTLEYVVSQPKKTGTSAGKKEEVKPLLPDVEAWTNLAEEVAWEKGATPVDKLPLIKGHEMSDEDRVKAWSIALYLIRRNPGWLRALDHTRARARGPAHVDEWFEKWTRKPLGRVEEEWRAFLTQPGAMARLCRTDWGGPKGISERAKELFIELGRERIRNGLVLLGWADNVSQDAIDLLDNTQARKVFETGRIPEKQTDSLVALLERGPELWLRALEVDPKARPKALINGWYDYPGYRDLILDPHPQFVGLWEGKATLLEPHPDQDPIGYVSTEYPRRGQTGVPRSMEVRDLGQDLFDKLLSLGVEKPRMVGYPLSIHFFGGLPAPKGDLHCRVEADGQELLGILWFPEDSRRRVLAAPGMVVFTPYEPLPGGKEITVTWSWKVEGMDKPVGRRYSFTTR